MSADVNSKAHPIYVYSIAFVAAVGGFLFGYDLNIAGASILLLQEHFGLNEGQVAWALGNAALGAMAGLLLGAWLADSALGRKWTLMLAATLFMVSAIGTALPRTFFEFNFYRILGGIGVGLASMISPMYIAEISPARIRGRLVTMNQLAIVVGATISIFVAYRLTPDMSGLSTEFSWRWMFASEAVPVFVLIIGLFFVPRSPRWLVQRGRLEDARAVLTKIDGASNADWEIQEILTTVRAVRGRLSELFAPGIRVALLIAAGLAFFQQWCGVSTLMFYATIIYQKAGFTRVEDSVFQMLVLNIFNIGVTMTALLIVDRLGRRPLLLFSAAGMAIGQFMIGTFLILDVGGKAIVFAMYFAMASYIVGLAPLAWLIMSEIFPMRLRARAMAVASVVVWASTATSVFFLGNVMAFFERTFGSPGGVFWVYSGICIVCLVFSYTIVPETKQRTLEEIGQGFLKRRTKSLSPNRPSPKP